MRFLNTIRKVHIEQAEKEKASRESPDAKRIGSESQKFQNAFAGGDLRIGTPNILEVTEIVENGGAVHPPIVNGNGGPNLSVVPAPTPVTRESQCEFVIDPERVNEHLVAINQPQSPYCEEYRSLRTHVVNACQKAGYKSIVMLSVSGSEGKSVTALNLAWLLAQTEGMKTLVIDGDLRRPSLENYLGFKTEIGLTDVLDSKAKLKDAVVRIEPAGLHFLPSGGARANVAELISGSHCKSVLEEARNSYDFVIIDTPPIGMFGDAAVLINTADCALMVIRADQVRYKDAEQALGLMPRERIIGAVLNHSEDPMIGRDYYNYSHYYKPRV